jgi:predicted permease
VILFAAAVTAVTALSFGLFPALHSTKPNLVNALKGQQGQPSGARSAAWFRSGLVTTQVALSMLLLAGAGLFVKSLFNVSRAELGVKTDHIATFGVSPQLNGYTAARSLELFARLEDELGALPGVTSVTASMVPLLSGSNWGNSLEVEGFQSGPDTDTVASFNKIGPGYFRTLGVPLIVGREFTREDAANGALVTVVNEQFTRKFNLGRTALGKHIQQGGRSSPQVEIVGVVADAKYSEVKDAPPPQFFTPYRQGETMGFLNFYVKTSLPPEQILPTITKVVARLDPNLPVERLWTLEEQVRQNVFLDRLLMVLSVSFAALATLLAAVGLYGVLAYTVALRTREIGLRMALGAAPERVRRMVLRQMGIMTAIGAVIGLGLAALAGSVAQSLLYELKGYDPAVFAASACLLALVAVGAGFVPALRASRVDPMTALRYE